MEKSSYIRKRPEQKDPGPEGLVVILVFLFHIAFWFWFLWFRVYYHYRVVIRRIDIRCICRCIDFHSIRFRIGLNNTEIRRDLVISFRTPRNITKRVDGYIDVAKG